MKNEMLLKKTKIFGDYGKKRLLDCSASFQDLAKTFMNIDSSESAGNERNSGGAHSFSEPDTETENNRYTHLLNRTRAESRTLLAEHLFEMADIMAEFADESMQGIKVEDRLLRRIERELKAKGVILNGLTVLMDKKKKYKLIASMHTPNDALTTTEDIGKVFSENLSRSLMPIKGSVIMLHGEDESVIFEEETKYKYHTGIARAIKEGENLFGDNYGILEVENGQLYIALSDGAGSGIQADKASKTVIELLEHFIESNFTLEAAIQMINGVLLASEEEKNLSTLDICHVDLNTCKCEFIKVGACNSYIRSSGLIEVVMSGTLPLGVFYRVEIEKTNGNLEPGDCVILFSDGIPDSLGDMEDLLAFEEMLNKVTYSSPQELANFILSYVIHASGGNIRDDMTVLVLEIKE